MANIKKSVSVSLIIFVVFIATVFIIGFTFNNKRGLWVPESPVSPVSSSGTNANTNSANTEITLTLAEIAKHNTASDCWLVVSSKAYDVTSYLDIHPAGPEAITPFCGKDATTAFETKGGKGKHSPNASQILKEYLLGDLNQKIQVK